MRAWVCVSVCFGMPINSCRHISFYTLCARKTYYAKKALKLIRIFGDLTGFPHQKRGKTFGVFHVRIAYIKFAQHKANFYFYVMCLTSDIVHDYKNKSFSFGAFGYKLFAHQAASASVHI